VSATRRLVLLATAPPIAAACRGVRQTSAEDDDRRALPALIAADDRSELDAVTDSSSEDVELIPPTGDALHLTRW